MKTDGKTITDSTQLAIISSPAFQSRLLRSEQWRASLLAFVWVALLLMVMLRRWIGGVVASSDAVFFPTVGLLVFGMLFEGIVFLNARRQLRTDILQRPKSRYDEIISIVVDLALPIIAMVIIQKFSPRGGYAALSAPVILVLPLVTMLCILRLRPMICFWTGLAAGAAHAGLTIIAIHSADINPNLWPLLFSYGLLLVLIGITAAAIAAQARAYVTQAVAETIAAEQTRRELANIEHDLSIARDIQMGLMPSTPPTIPNFDIAGMARPAQQAGGDYYDWQQMPDGRLVVALADVTGHGIGPALVMAVCRAYGRATAPSTPDPEALLAGINSLIFDDLKGTGRFITMVIAILSPDGTVELISAGHGPTLLYRKSTGDISTFGGDGIPLGLDAAEQYGPHTKLKMESGDVLLLLTDGFVEWQRTSDRAQFGTDRLCNTLSCSAAYSAQSILNTIDAAVSSFAEGAQQLDDTTAVVIRRV
jgi:serine phosphatase RsbU (regulator of sigma subunit)